MNVAIKSRPLSKTPWNSLRMVLYCGALSLIGSAVSAWAGPREVIQAAIQKVAQSDNYSWEIVDSDFMDERPVPIFLPGQSESILCAPSKREFGYAIEIDGKVQQDGLMTVKVNSGYQATHRQIVAISKGDKIAIETSDGWKTDKEIAVPKDQSLRLQVLEPFAVLASRCFKSPLSAAQFMLDQTKDIQFYSDRDPGGQVADLYRGRLSDEETQRLIPPPPGRDANNNLSYVPVVKASATVTFTVSYGLLGGFEVELHDAGHVPHIYRSVSMGFNEIGYTTFFPPDAAIAAMGLVPPAKQSLGAGKVVALDYYYNHQLRDGKQFGCIWDDAGASGYSDFGHIWGQNGATLASIEKAPTRKDLDHYSVYIIANPSTEQNAAEHPYRFIQSDAIDAIVSWVQDGGVLVLFANSKGNCEIDHLNELAGRFGIGFKHDLSSTVPRSGGFADIDGQKMQMGLESVQYSSWPIGLYGLPDHVLFNGVKTIRINETCTLGAFDSARTMLTVNHWWPSTGYVDPPPRPWYQGLIGSPPTRREHHPGIGSMDFILAEGRLGKGLVFAAGNPWFFNANIDTASPDTNDNRLVADNLARWLLTISSIPRQ